MSKVNVATAKSKLDTGVVYAGGCTEYVAECLGLPQKHSSLWNQGASVGTNNAYSGLTPGDIVGWPPKYAGGSGHVAVYIGEATLKFIDVPGPGNTTRRIRTGYGSQQLWKYSY